MAQDFWNTAERMNPTVKEIWLRALRSGDYTQGRGALAYQRKSDGQWCHCPIGVLTEEAIKAGVIIEKKDFSVPRDTGGYAEYSIQEDALFVRGFDWLTTCMGDKVAKWAGLPSSNSDIFLFSASPQSHAEGQDSTIIRANDIQKLSFAEIADLIDFIL